MKGAARIMVQVYSRLCSAVAKVFKIRNILVIFVGAGVGWAVRFLLITVYGLDLGTLLGFFSVVIPAGLVSALARELASSVVEHSTLEPVSSSAASETTFLSGRGSGSGSGSGSGRGLGSGSGSGGISKEEFRLRNMRELASANAKYIEQLNRAQAQAQVQAQVQAQAEADAQAQNQRKMADLQAAQEAERRSRTQAAIAKKAVENAARLQTFANAPGNNVGALSDVAGIGARGFQQGGINQPYATVLAQELERQGIAGSLTEPNLDPVARRFLAGALPHLRPDVYGPNPTKGLNVSMIVRDTIRDLKRMP